MSTLCPKMLKNSPFIVKAMNQKNNKYDTFITLNFLGLMTSYRQSQDTQEPISLKLSVQPYLNLRWIQFCTILKIKKHSHKHLIIFRRHLFPH